MEKNEMPIVGASAAAPVQAPVAASNVAAGASAAAPVQAPVAASNVAAGASAAAPVQAPVAASNVAAGASAAAPVQAPVHWDPYEPVQYDAPKNPYDTTIVDYDSEVESSDVDSDDESFHTKTRHVLRRLQSGQYGRPFAQGIYKCPFCNRRLFDTNFNTLLNHAESIGSHGARVGSTVNVHAYMAKHKALGIHLRNLQASHTRHLEALNVPTALSEPVEEEIDEPESSLDEKEEEIDEPESSLDEKEEESNEQKEEEWISYPCQPSNEKRLQGAAAIAKLQFGDRTLCSGTCRTGKCPEAISIDATASIMLHCCDPNHEASHNLALKARADHGGEEEYEIEEDEEMTSTSDIATDFAFFAKKYKGKLPMLLNDKKKKRTCYNCDEESHFANECPYEKRVDKPKFIKGVKPRLKPNPINDRYKRNKGRAFVGAEYLSDEEEEDEEKEAGVAGLAFSKPGSLFTYDYSKDYSTENDVGSSFMARTTQDDDSDDSTSSTIVGSCLMARETKVMEPPPSLSSVLDDETENQEELTVLKELYNVRHYKKSSDRQRPKIVN
ncbi:hypothetical protein QYE76_025535 [Lolium multiflorum]|uniref:CCHC-type domain-containing protein n=1 Tax=Lolium multiflorum TaxID=4521 RepID=A0AAD8REA1_LOLMU|nr:hypothetical protein QYE76_025535 [Lolium multiflorum]